MVSPPPDETFIWHCKRHTLPTIGDPCLHCSKWIVPTTRQLVSTIHRAEPRSVVMELLINHLFAQRDTLTAEQEAAMTTYVLYCTVQYFSLTIISQLLYILNEILIWVFKLILIL